jgi:hypothetical protein
MLNGSKNSGFNMGTGPVSRILKDIVLNAQDNGNGWTCIDNIQDAWKQATIASSFDSVANKLHKCTTLGRFKYDKYALKAQWKYKMENERMEEFKNVYFEGDSDTSVGCVARQCSRSKSDVL